MGITRESTPQGVSREKGTKLSLRERKGSMLQKYYIRNCT